MIREGKPSVLIDTDVAIDFLQGKEYAKKLLEGLWEKDTAHISILSVYELFAIVQEFFCKKVLNLF